VPEFSNFAALQPLRVRSEHRYTASKLTQRCSVSLGGAAVLEPSWTSFLNSVKFALKAESQHRDSQLARQQGFFT
jgi:hypothetical protein